MVRRIVVRWGIPPPSPELGMNGVRGGGMEHPPTPAEVGVPSEVDNGPKMPPS